MAVIAANAGEQAVDHVPIPTFEAIYDEYLPYVYRSAQGMGVSKAGIDDVVQEVFLVVYRRLAEFEGRSSLKTWLYGIVIRIVRQHRRSLRRKSPHAEGTVDPEKTLSTRPEDSPDERASSAEAARLLMNILDALDDEKREVFVLAELEQLSVPEIAESLAVNLNTVYSRLRAARREFSSQVARHRARNDWRTR